MTHNAARCQRADSSAAAAAAEN